MRFSNHARQRLRERKISEQDAAGVVDNYEVAFSDTKGNPCFVRTVSERRIKVVVSAADPDFVITVIDLDA